MKPILFSRVFPAKHPHKGNPTCFSQQIHNGQKIHTIRAGHRWKPGDVFEPREWSGTPYRSHQQVIGDPLTVTVTYAIKRAGQSWLLVSPTGKQLGLHESLSGSAKILDYIAANDGLTLSDFLAWFPETFDGQIICWTDDPYAEFFSNGKPTGQ